MIACGQGSNHFHFQPQLHFFATACKLILSRQFWSNGGFKPTKVLRLSIFLCTIFPRIKRRNQTASKADQNRNRALSIFTDGRTLGLVAACKNHFAGQLIVCCSHAGQVCNKEQLSLRLCGAVLRSDCDDSWAENSRLFQHPAGV